MDWTLEVAVVPVGDVDRAIAFYRDQVGFNLDHDTRAGDQRLAQLTPPGSGCSIVLSQPSPMPPGSLRGLQLVVADAYRARDELVSRGIVANEIEVVDERDGGTMFGFTDPDGNAWVVQQIKARAAKPVETAANPAARG
jgi:predicted enzyme related to lactoylglutathione lyase